MRIGKLDGYVFRSVVTWVLLCSALLVSLYVVVDLFSKVGEFMEIKGRPMIGFMAKYYLLRIPLILSQVLPMIVLCGSAIAMGRMVRLNELMPMLGAGRSMYRVLAPVFVVAFAAMLMQFAMDEFLVPHIARRLVDTDRIRQGPRTDSLVISKDGMGNEIFAQSYNRLQREMTDVVIVRTFPGGSIERITAQSAKWKKSGEFGVWLLSNGSRETRDARNKRQGAADKFGPGGFVLPSDLAPEELGQKEDLAAYASLTDLYRLMARYPDLSFPRVRMHVKVAFPLANIVLLGLGLPLILSREPRRFLIGLVTCVLLCIGFFIIQLLLVTLANKEQLNPVIAAWSPMIFFGFVGIFMMDNVQT